jgi:uncharacterized protein (TIGR00369 family)
MTLTPTHHHHETPLQRVQASFGRQGLMQHLGACVLHVASGECVIGLPYSDKVTQQQGAFHGGAIGALADIAAGYAALTQTTHGMEVVSVEYKINFLASRQGGELRATGRVLKAGQRIVVTSAEVMHIADDGSQTLCAVLQQTVLAVSKNY